MRPIFIFLFNIKDDEILRVAHYAVHPVEGKVFMDSVEHII